MVWSWLRALAAWLAAVVFLAGAAGCGINKSLTDAQQERDMQSKLAWADKAIALAESHGVAYRVEINASGRPSLGETVDLYLDSGIDARIIFFGNAAAGRKPGGSGAVTAPTSGKVTEAQKLGFTPPIFKPSPTVMATTQPAP